MGTNENNTHLCDGIFCHNIKRTATEGEPHGVGKSHTLLLTYGSVRTWHQLFNERPWCRDNAHPQRRVLQVVFRESQKSPLQ